MPKKKIKKVWDFMERTSEGKVCCLVCKNVISDACGSLSSLVRHLKQHPNEWQLVKDSLQKVFTENPMNSDAALVSNKEISENHVQYGKDSERRQELDWLLIQMIYEDMQPLSIVNNKGFRKLAHALDERYCLPDIETLSKKDLPVVFEILQEQLQVDLDNVPCVALSTDIWTACERETHLTVTAHYITDKWVLISKVLETKKISIDTENTAEDLAEALKSILVDWKIQEKIIAVVTDNSPTIVQAVEDLKYPHVPCFAYSLQLVIKKSIERSKDVLSVIEKIREAMFYFSEDETASTELEVLQLQNNKPNLKLEKDVEERWNSTYYMLETYVMQIEYITTVLCAQGKPQFCLSVDEFSLAKQIVKSLKPFEIALTEMCAVQFITLSTATPMIRAIYSNLDSPDLRDLPLSNVLVEEMQRQFSDWESNDSHAMSTFLDPRYKKFGLPLSVVTETEEKVKIRMQELTVVNNIKEEPVEQDSETVSVPNTDSTSLWADFDALVREHEMQRPDSQPLELRSFHDERHLDRHSDPIEWWGKNHMMLPNLSKLARRFLCIPATSVPAKKLFSDAGDLINTRRSCLESETIDMILFMNNNGV